MGVLQILLIAAIIVVAIVRRFAGAPALSRRAVVLPLVLVVIGFNTLRSGTHGSSLTGHDVAYLMVSAAISLALGMARGISVRVYRQDGVPWARYTAVTAVLWVLLIVVRLGLEAMNGTFGVTHTFAVDSLLLMFGLSLGMEALTVAARSARA
jgi:hypothetical protein